jgi:dienelactone hydrolase
MPPRRTLIAAALGTAIAGAAGSGTAAAAPPITQRHSTRVTVVDVTIPVPGQQPVPAYLVKPARPVRPRSLAGLLYLHWFEPGQSTQNRTEYLAEAVRLAAAGAVAVLPQLRFPWEANPVGDERDRDAVTAQQAAVDRAHRALLEQAEVSPSRIAVVGHDYGAMYGAILAQRSPHVRAQVFMAGDATWSNWFDTYWLFLPPEQKPAYHALFAGLDPIEHVTRLGSHLFFQWGGDDRFVPAAIRDAFTQANPSAKATFYEHAEHFLTQQAKEDRMAWISEQLSLRAEQV